MKLVINAAGLALLSFITSAAAQDYKCAPPGQKAGALECRVKTGLLVYSEPVFSHHKVWCALPQNERIAILEQNAKANWYRLGFADNTSGYIPYRDDEGGSTVSGACEETASLRAAD
jgi:hypothetical protein